METRSTARNRTSIDHGAEDAPAAETGARFSENASTHADNAEAAVMASADLMGGQQFGAESPDASDAENAPPRSSSCPPARGRQTSAVQPGQAQQARATPVSRESSGLLRASHRVSGQSPGTPRLSRHGSPLPASVAGGSGERGDNFSSFRETCEGSGFEPPFRVPLGNIQLPQSQRDFSTRYPHPIPPQRARSGSSGAARVARLAQVVPK